MQDNPMAVPHTSSSTTDNTHSSEAKYKCHPKALSITGTYHMLKLNNQQQHTDLHAVSEIHWNTQKHDTNK